MNINKHMLAVLAYVLPTFPLGYFWHLSIFSDYYQTLNVYRENILIPFGIVSMLVQGVIWSIIYQRLFVGNSLLKGAVKFAILAFLVVWSFMVIAVAAKHHMSSVSGFVLIESAFLMLQYLLVSPLIAAAHRVPRTFEGNYTSSKLKA